MTTQTKTTLPDRSREAKAGWRKVKLGEVAKWHYGFPLLEKNRNGGSVPVYGSSGIIGYHDSPMVPPRAVIIGRKGNVGNVYYSPTASYPIDTVFYIDPRDTIKTKVYPKFLYYLLKKIPFIKIGSDTGVPGLNRNIAYELEINIPGDETIQQRITDILSAFDDKIELNNKISAVLEQTAQAIFKEWFIKNDMLPKGWVMKTFGELSKNFDSKRVPFSNMVRAKRKGSIPYYGATGIVDYIDEALFDGEYLLIAEDGTVSDDAGRPILQFIKGKFWVNNHAHIVQGMSGVPTHYLYLFLKGISITPYITGAVQLKLTQENLNSIPILLPDRETLKKYDQIVGPIFKKMRTINYENQKLAALRDLLLPKLMSAEIRV